MVPIAYARITRQWPDGITQTVEVGSDLDTPEQVAAALVKLDRLAAPDDTEAEQ